MSDRLHQCQVWPRIVAADQVVAVMFQPISEADRFTPDIHWQVRHLGLLHPVGPLARDAWVSCTVDPADGSLTVECLFEGEQEHILSVYGQDDRFNKPVATVRLYSLAPDLFARTPYKGDLHMHSSRSDGREPPAQVAAACRSIGFDFMALTDHGLYGPSLEAQAAFADAAVDLRIFPGEEVHPPENPMHIINFGGTRSINDLFKDPSYPDWIAAADQATGSLPAGVDRYEYVSAAWVFDQIRQAGGLGIYSHPYWTILYADCRQGLNISESLISCLFDRQPYDAYEVIGGYNLVETDSNVLQVARYHDERARGRQIPIVGVSDAHGCFHGELFGWYYTIVFAASLDLDDLIGSIRDLYSVAVEVLPNQAVRVHGPRRLVQYALFLIREMMPQHDRLCQAEGQLMLDLIAGNSQAGAGLLQLSGQTAALMNRFYSRGQQLADLA